MLVFIDESGCPGFKLARGSDAVFAIGMVIFESPRSAAETRCCLAALRARLKHKPEFRFSKASDRLRDSFIKAVADCPFRVRCFVVRKSTLNEVRMRESGSDFYKYSLGELVRRAAARLESVSLKIDGNGSRHFERELKRDTRLRLGSRLADLRIVDSRRDDLTQLADMCVGAVARSYRPHDQSDRWVRLLSGRIEDVYVFG